MTNKILKMHLKKIIKSEAFVSVIIVFVLAIGIIGTSYALYMDVDTDTNYQLVEVGDLSIAFNDGDSSITLENLTPTSNEIATGAAGTEISEEISKSNVFSFYIYNTGTYTANYDIKLETVTGNTVDTKYINYQICRDNKDNCKEISTLSDTTNSVIYTDELTPNSTALDTSNTSPSAYYFIRLWINDQYPGTSGTIKLNVVIEAKNASGYLDTNNTLAGRLLNDERVTVNNSVPDFSSIADYKVTGDSSSGELGLFKANDDYGVSYYYRGAQSNNYIDFAGMCWRIVRINGDGSIKLILEDQTSGCKSADGNWNIPASDGETITYQSDGVTPYLNGNFGFDYLNMNGVLRIINYLNPNSNEKNRAMVNAFKYFQKNSLKDYTSYLKSGDWCLNNTAYLNESVNFYNASPLLEGEKYTDLDGNGNVEFFYYDSYIRLYGNKNTYGYSPSLKCNGTNMNYFHDGEEMFVGSLTASEIALAGGKVEAINTNNYLVNEYQKTNLLGFWTFSPSSYKWGSDSVYCGLDLGDILEVSMTQVADFRPSVNLKPGVLYDTGEGTSTKPYTVKLY